MKTFILGTGNFSIFKKLIDHNSEIIIFNSISSLSDRLKVLDTAHPSDEHPDMILGELEVLSENKEQEVHDLIFHTKILKIPFFALTSEINEYTKAKAASVGCNDIYNYNEDITKLLNRMAFLKRVFKITDLDNSPTDERIHLDMPLLKRSFDIVFSLIVLLLVSPLMLIVAIAIKLESGGPVFYVSKRAGSGYKVFDFYKFRTMKHGADRELSTLMCLNQYGADQSRGKQSAFIKINNDPRVTKIGAFLRKTSIDELPQFINVLKGDMSIVGNRPLPLYEAEILTDDKSARRFLAPAGITGLWQVTKRGKKEMSDTERKELDVNYATNWDVWIDFKILLKTIPALLQKEAV